MNEDRRLLNDFQRALAQVECLMPAVLNAYGSAMNGDEHNHFGQLHHHVRTVRTIVDGRSRQPQSS